MNTLPPEMDDEPEEQAPDFLSVPPVEGVDSSTDEATIRKKRKRVTGEQAKTDAFWRAVLADDAGRAAMWGLLRKWGALSTPSGVTPTGFPDPMTTGFHLGRQSAGRELYNLLATTDRAAVLLMHDQHDPTYIAAIPAKTRMRIVR